MTILIIRIYSNIIVILKKNISLFSHGLKSIRKEVEKMDRQGRFTEIVVKQAGLTIKDGLAVEEEFDEDDLKDLATIKDVEVEEEIKPELVPAALIPLSLVVRNPNQPRKIFNQEKLMSMAQTIRARRRITNPVLVTPRGNKFMLISGERRWRASKIAGVKYILAVVTQDAGDDLDIFEEAVIANSHQERMALPEEAYALKRLMIERVWSQSELARHMGKTSGEISNIFKLFKLDEELQAMLLSGKIQPGPVLQLATFEVDVQMLLWEDLNREVVAKFDNNMPHPNMVARIVRRLAEERGIRPRKPRKGKMVDSHAEMVIRSLKRTIKKLGKEIEELGDLSVEALRLVGDSEIYNILSNLEQTAELIEDRCHQVKNKLNI